MSSTDNQRIEPEVFSPVSPKADSTSQPEKPTSNSLPTGQNSSILYILGGLVTVAVLVLIIPLFFSTGSDGVDGSAPLDSEIAQTLSEENTPAESPWVDSQLLKARREAQEILAELLSLQQRLESVQIEKWNPENYQQIQALAIEGDSLYQEREFEPALNTYTHALELALQVDASMPQVAAEYFEKGSAALELNDIEPALEQLQLADLLLPGDPEITDTLSRASVRQQIMSLSAQAKDLARAPENLEQAEEKLLQAIAMDSTYVPLQSQIDEIRSMILERDFRAAMSLGFSSLAAADYPSATQAFNKANILKPNTEAVTRALQQVEAAKLNNARQTALAEAERHEANEEWAQALAIYEQLKQEDSSLSAARLGAIRSQARDTLDKDIQDIIDNPLSLQSDSRWRSANQTLSEARAIANPGDRLSEQTRQLQQILQRARTPVVLKLESDNQTDIEIYRIGKLGTFVEQAMHLNPGKYVIVGTRSGYKDVRVELEIDGNTNEITLPVICTQTI